jgi:hypothetical protein
VAAAGNRGRPCRSLFQPQQRRWAAFVVFTSNAFAVLGLPSLYFVLAEAMDASPTSPKHWPPC